MGKSIKSKKTKYQGVSVPVCLIEEIKDHVKDNPKYRSISEFVRVAILERLKNDMYNKKLESGEIKPEKHDNLNFRIVENIGKLSKKINNLEKKIDKIDKEKK